MALTHRTVVGGIQIDRTGDASVQLRLIVGDGADEFSTTNYRFPINKGASVAAIASEVNASLVGQRRQPMPNKAVAVIKATLEACWAAMDA